MIKNIKSYDNELYDYLISINSFCKRYLSIAQIVIYYFINKYYKYTYIYLYQKIYILKISKIFCFNKKKYRKNYWDDLPNLKFGKIKDEPFNDEINLASKKIFFKKNSINWEKKYKDPENTMSLHRFGWLIQKFIDNNSNTIISDGIFFINNWINSDKQKKGLRWDNYTASERVVYWLLFFCIKKENLNITRNDKDEIAKVIINHLQFILSTIDYWGRYSNNHLINNARALYIGGKLIGSNYYSEIGKKILFNETDSLIPNGVLKEGSSHYQILVTRNYLEIYFIANLFSDNEFVLWLENRLIKMLECAQMFTINNNNNYSSPLFGDISPDFPPFYFFGKPFLNDNNFNSSSKWSKIWMKLDSYQKILNINHKKNAVVNKKQQWILLKKDKYKIFSMVNDGSIKSHLHQDQGSFCLYYNDHPVIIDPGLKSYLWKDKITQYQENYKSHSSISIDGIGIAPSKLSKLNLFSFHRPSKIEFTNNGFQLLMKGFLAKGRLIEWTRSFNIKNELIIEDCISTKNNEKISINYIFDKTVEIKSNNKTQYGNNNNFDFILSINAECNNRLIDYDEIKNFGGYKSEHYGDIDSCKIMNMTFNCDGEIKINSIFNFNN